MNHEEAAPLLPLYQDGELDTVTCLKLEEHLAACPSCRKKMEEEKKLIEIIRTEAPRFTAPPFLKTRIRAALKEEKVGPTRIPWWKPFPSAWRYSSFAVALVILLTSLFLWKPRTSELAQEAVANHIRSLQVNHLMDVASTDQHTVKPWFAGKLDYSPQVVDLTPSGYPLIGGRLDVLNHHNVAAIIYQRRKHYINLFIWPPDGESVPHRFTLNGYHVLGWTKAGMNYLAVSELGEKELSEFTVMIQDQTVDSRPGE